jgi:hypothetical protein
LGLEKCNRPKIDVVDCKRHSGFGASFLSVLPTFPFLGMVMGKHARLGLRMGQGPKIDVVDPKCHSGFGASFLSAGLASLPTLLFFTSAGGGGEVDVGDSI